MKAIVYKIEITWSIQCPRRRSFWIHPRWQAIYRAWFDQTATVETLKDILIIFAFYVLHILLTYYIFCISYILHFMYFTLYTYFLVLHFAFHVFY